MPDLVWIALPGRPWTCARVIRDGGPGRAVTVSLFGVGVWVERRHLRQFKAGCRKLAARRGT